MTARRVGGRAVVIGLRASQPILSRLLYNPDARHKLLAGRHLRIELGSWLRAAEAWHWFADCRHGAVTGSLTPSETAKNPKTITIIGRSWHSPLMFPIRACRRFGFPSGHCCLGTNTGWHRGLPDSVLLIDSRP